MFNLHRRTRRRSRLRKSIRVTSCIATRINVPCAVLVGLALGCTLSCTRASPLNAPPSAGERVCPAGTFYYGDGMVASRLPEATLTALTQARKQLLAQTHAPVSPFLAHVPWRPHVSVIYGVTDARISPAHKALQAFLVLAHASRACLGSLHYWDDARGDKTVVVVDVDEPQKLFDTLHDRLTDALELASRFAYHPHVTLGYLAHNARLDDADEAHIRAVVHDICWPVDAFYITDPCGRSVAEATTADALVPAAHMP